jgi:putative peptidoglycan lipid II flippase
VFEACYAVLAISVAISAFTVLAVHEGREFDQTAAGAARAVLLLSFLGTAVLAAVAVPAAHFLVTYQHQAPQLAAGFALFALGLGGYGLIACLSRVLLAAGRTAITAVIVAGGWLLVIAADVVLVLATPAPWVVADLALGNTVGLTAAGVALAVAVRRLRGAAALHGTLRAGVCGIAAATAGAGAGAGVAAALPMASALAEGFIVLLAAVCAVAAFGLVAWYLDAGDVRAALVRVRRAAWR